MEKEKISVFGTGVMGCGIAQLISLYGYDVVIKSRTEEALQNALKKIQNQFRKRF